MPQAATRFFVNTSKLIACCLIILLGSCTQPPPSRDADVIVVGAGIAGLSAAIEAAAHGARVLVIDANSVGGGHAVKAGGMALVNTTLQQQRGIEDSPWLAIGDLLAWGEDPDPYWVNRYAMESAPEVYDWLTDLGVEFTLILDAPESSVPRFHFTRGTAINIVVPLLRKAMYEPDIEFIWNTRVTALAQLHGRVTGISGENLRDGTRRLYRAHNVILATGGFQNNLDEVRANWNEGLSAPERILAGAGKFALGDGYRLASWAGADLRRMDQQEIFYNGLPDPRDPDNQRGLVARNPAALWVNASGRRFVNETESSKHVAAAIREQQPAGYWLIFDSVGARRFSVRDASWLNQTTIRQEILLNPAIVARSDSLSDLALRAGLPPRTLQATAETWNRMVAVGEDFRYGRFGPGNMSRAPQALNTPPYYAVHMLPLTRKSMGGPAIDGSARVLTPENQPIAGLYAAGELTGAAGINGRHGGSGTFLGPGVLTGRIAGRAAAQDALATKQSGTPRPLKISTPPAAVATLHAPGYWHYSMAHERVQELGYSCERCHAGIDYMAPAADELRMLAQLETCTTCH